MKRRIVLGLLALMVMLLAGCVEQKSEYEIQKEKAKSSTKPPIVNTTTTRSTTDDFDEYKARSAADAYCSKVMTKQKNITSMKYVRTENQLYDGIEFIYEVKWSNLSYARLGILTVIKQSDGSYKATGIQFND